MERRKMRHQSQTTALSMVMDYRERLLYRCIQVAQWLWQACLTLNPYALWTSDHIWDRCMLWYCALRSRLKADSGERQRLLEWVRSKVNRMRSPSNLTSDWSDGILMCNLLEALVPGSCPRHDLLNPDNALSNVQMAINLIGRHLAINPSLTAKEMVEMAPGSENNLMVLLAQLKMASAKSMLRKTLALPIIQDPENNKEGFLNSDQECVAKGMGLVLAVKGRKASFNIYLKSSCNLNVVIEIRGPGNSLCSERITNRSPKRKTPIKAGVLAALNFSDLTSRLSRSNSSISTIGDSEDSEQHTIKIPFEYEVLVGKVYVGYIPVNTGKHRLSIIWQGQHIMGSPYIVTVDETGESQLDMKPKPPRRHSLTLKRLDSTDITTDATPTLQTNVGKENELLSADSSEQTGTNNKSSESLKFNGRARGRGTVTRRRVLRHIVKVDGKDIVIEDSSPQDFALAVQALRTNETALSKKPLTRQYSLDSKWDRRRDYPNSWYLPIDETEGELHSTIVNTTLQRWVESSEVVTKQITLSEGRERAISAPEHIFVNESNNCNVNKNEQSDIGVKPLTERNTFTNDISEISVSSERSVSLPSDLNYEPMPSPTQETKCLSKISRLFEQDVLCNQHEHGLDVQMNSMDNKNGINEMNQHVIKKPSKVDSMFTEYTPKEIEEEIIEKTENHNQPEKQVHLSAEIKLKCMEVKGNKCANNLFHLEQENHIEKLEAFKNEGNQNEIQIFQENEREGNVHASIVLASSLAQDQSSEEEQKENDASNVASFEVKNLNSPEIDWKNGSVLEKHIHFPCSHIEYGTAVSHELIAEEGEEWLVVSVDAGHNNIAQVTSTPHTDTEPYEDNSIIYRDVFTSVGNRRQFFEEMSIGSGRLEHSMQGTARSGTFRGRSQLSQTNSVDSSPKVMEGKLGTRSHSCDNMSQTVPGSGSPFYRAKEFWEKGNNCELEVEHEENKPNQTCIVQNESKNSIRERMMFWEMLADPPQKKLRSPLISVSKDEKETKDDTESSSSLKHQKPDGSNKRDVTSMAFKSLGRKNIQDSHLTDFKRQLCDLTNPDSESTIDSGVFEDQSITYQEQEVCGKNNALQQIASNNEMADFGGRLGEPVTIIFKQNPLFSLGTVQGRNPSFIDESSMTGTSTSEMTDDKGFIDDDIPDYASIFMDKYVSFTGLLENDRCLSRRELLGIDDGTELETDRTVPFQDPFFKTNSSVFLPRAGLCRAYGSGVYYGQVGIRNHFQVCTREAGRGYLTVSVQGPGQHDVNEIVVSYAGGHLYEVMYDVAEPGYYIISVKWSDWNIPQSPFICKVTF